MMLTRPSSLSSLTAAVALVTSLVALGCGSRPPLRLSSWWRPSASHDPPYTDHPAHRIEQLDQLARRASQMTDTQRAEWAARLSDEMGHQTNVLVQRAMIRTLTALGTPEAIDAVRRATQDARPLVREAACEALGSAGSASARDTLIRVMANDPDSDVRVAAAEALAGYPERQAIIALGRTLEDRDPALQYVAVQSLRQISPQDVGNSLQAWRQYVASLPAAEGPQQAAVPAASQTESLPRR